MNNLSNRPQCRNFGKNALHATKQRLKILSENLQKQYYDNPKICPTCSKHLPYKGRKNTFCSKTCSALHNNHGRIISEDQKKKTSNTLKVWNAIHRPPKTPKKIKPFKLPTLTKAKKEIYPFSRIRPCRVCLHYMNGHSKIYCDDCHPNIHQYRSRCNFIFNIFNYPDDFDLDLIAKHGWYSPGGHHGRNKKINMTGVSRDHIFSISEGYKSNIDPTILSHPANCRLMLHSENNKKHCRSVISLDELIERIHIWNDSHQSIGGW